jgi:hypothetical protein
MPRDWSQLHLAKRYGDYAMLEAGPPVIAFGTRLVLLR